MATFRIFVAACSLFLFSATSNVIADDKSTVQTFYDFLSNPASEDHAAAFRAATAENWKSIGDHVSGLSLHYS